jgi:hypothetical protein
VAQVNCFITMQVCLDHFWGLVCLEVFKNSSAKGRLHFLGAAEIHRGT